MLDFNKIVKTLCKKRGKLFFKEDIFELIDPEKKDTYHSLLNRTIYQLKAKNIILGVKAGVYVIPDEDDYQLNKVDLLDKYYLKLLKKIIIKYVGNNYYVSGVKSLEFHLKNYEIPEKIFIINRSINKRVKVGTKEIILKTISGRINTGKVKKLNLYSKLSQHTIKKIIDGTELRISCLELALLESSLVTDSELGCDIGILTKTLKKYSAVLDLDIFYKIGEYKYIMSFNRLKEISKTIEPELYKVFLDVIKKNGGLFIGEGLRAI